MSIPQPTRRFTPKEYYQSERTAAYKSDYYEGEIFDMSGGTSRHSLICVNLVGELRQMLKGKTCTTYESNLRLRVISNGLRCYPDASVYRDRLQHDIEDDGLETATNPTVLVKSFRNQPRPTIAASNPEAIERSNRSKPTCWCRRRRRLSKLTLASRTAPGNCGNRLNWMQWYRSRQSA